MTHGGDVGYELQSSLLVDVDSGLPVAPQAQTLTDSKGCRSTLTEGLSDSQTHMGKSPGRSPACDQADER